MSPSGDRQPRPPARRSHGTVFRAAHGVRQVRDHRRRRAAELAGAASPGKPHRQAVARSMSRPPKKQAPESAAPGPSTTSRARQRSCWATSRLPTRRVPSSRPSRNSASRARNCKSACFRSGGRKPMARRFPAPWRADTMPGGSGIHLLAGRAVIEILECLVAPSGLLAMTGCEICANRARRRLGLRISPARARSRGKSRRAGLPSGS
jgi:hypothetical protein